MKRILAALCILALCPQHITFPMERTIPLNDAIAIVNMAINKNLKTNNSLNDKNKIQSTDEEDFFTIINSITQCPIIPNRKLIKGVCQQNKYFKQAIKHFTRLARINIDNVTIQTLETIKNPTLPQPTTPLNNLPASIKKYVMKYAYHRIKHQYNIILSGHTATINFFEICPAAHLVATSSYDKTLRLWDLTTGKFIHQFPGKNNTADCINFNPDGSRLVTTMHYHNKPSTIKIWNTQSAELLHSKELAISINTINYASNDILIACSIPSRKPDITVFKINKDNTIKIVAQTKLAYRASHLQLPFMHWNNLYIAKNPYNPATSMGSALTIVKQNCRTLYLCEQAIKNIRKTPHADITALPLFQRLTAYEIKKILDLEFEKAIYLRAHNKEKK